MHAFIVLTYDYADGVQLNLKNNIWVKFTVHSESNQNHRKVEEHIFIDKVMNLSCEQFICSKEKMIPWSIYTLVDSLYSVVDLFIVERKLKEFELT